MNNRISRLCIIAVAFLLVSMNAAAETQKPIVSLPLERTERGALHVRTFSRDGVLLRVVFDTAAENSVLFDHEGTLKVPRLLGGDKTVYFPFTGRLLDFRRLKQFTLAFGKHHFTSNNWVTGPWQPTGLFPGRKVPHYDVIAGRDVFQTFVVAIDPYRKKLNLHENADGFIAAYDSVIDLVHIRSHIAVKIMVNRLDTKIITEKLMIIDTGFPGVLMFADNEQMTLLNIDDDATPADTLTAALTVPTEISIADMPAVAQDIYIVARGAFKADGVIGTGFLNNYRYAFDLAANKFYVSAE